MIFYFSATGNSLYTARRIAETEGARLVPISEKTAVNRRGFAVSEGEAVGFVFPVYFFGLPTIVSDFLSRLSFSGGNPGYTYLVLTCGGGTGNAGSTFEKALARTGRGLSALFSVAMIDTYIPLYAIPGIEKQREVLAAADRTIDDIIAKITARETGRFDRLRGFLPGLMTTLAHTMYRFDRKTAPFRAQDTCTGCGLCGDICPCGAIEMSDGRPSWTRERCVQCLGCINRCPVCAIEYGAKTVGKGRYVNPKVELPGSAP